MSEMNFQRVMAQLIRFPADSLDVVENRLNRPELSASERRRLVKMAEDPLVRKYGRKMSYCRFRDATQVLPLTKKIVPEDLLDQIFFEGFERSRTETDFVMLGVQFAEYMLNTPKWADVLDGTAPYTRDVIQYERAKASIVRQVIRYEDPALPEGTRLRHVAFEMIDLEHDIPSFDKAHQEESAKDSPPQPKSMKLIFLRSEQPPFYRMFQIDEAVQEFLTIQRGDPKNWARPLPPFYEGMVGVGLCHALQ